MKKFGEIYKQKLNESETRQEGKVLDDFKVVYNAMLEHYGLKSVHDLDEDSQLSFLTEINHYWSEEAGLNEKGQSFIDKRSMSLNENSTAVQKKNFLRNRSYAVINETLRQSNIKFRLYDVIDEMYKQLNAQDIAEILTPDMITNIISESFHRSLDEFTTGIKKELTESVKPKRKYFVKTNARKINEGSTAEEIIKGQNIPPNDAKEFQENALVTPRQHYKNVEEIKGAMGRITKIEPEKITYTKQSDGKLYSMAPNDLIIIKVNVK